MPQQASSVVKLTVNSPANKNTPKTHKKKRCKSIQNLHLQSIKISFNLKDENYFFPS